MSIRVRMVYHFEDGSWWADSDDAPGYYAGAETLEQLRKSVREGLEFHLEDSVDGLEEVVEIVSTTHPRDDIEIEQRVYYPAADVLSLGSTQLTTTVSGLIRRLPVPAMVFLTLPSTAHGKAMAGY